MLKKHWKGLLLSIVIALAFGYPGNLLGGSSDSYASLIKPWFAPPAAVFPIVWTALYILMGISAFLVYQASGRYRTLALLFYGAHLIVTSLWPLFFFRLEW